MTTDEREKRLANHRRAWREVLAASRRYSSLFAANAIQDTSKELATAEQELQRACRVWALIDDALKTGHPSPMS